jgi:uncharacterized protein involved in response to NO
MSPRAVAGARVRPPFANAIFFPAASAYAIVIVPWWVLGHLGVVAVPPALMLPLGHAHELLFGFAAAVIAGFLLGPQPIRVTIALVVAWLAARVSFLAAPGTWAAGASAAIFAAGLAARVVPRFGLAARQWRNRTIAPVVAVFALLIATAAWLGAMPAPLAWTVLIEALLLVSLLMFFIGGRIIAPSLAGHLLRRGHYVAARVQPSIEGAALMGLFVVMLLVPFAHRWTDRAAGLALLAVAALTTIRIVRWQPWRCGDRPDLHVLVLGYAWLPVGYTFCGLALWGTGVPLSAAVHAIGVGGLGMLTLAVMARTRLLYLYRDPNAMPAAHVAAALVGAAGAVRVGASLVPAEVDVTALLVSTALLWSLAFAMLLVVLLRAAFARRRVRPAADMTLGDDPGDRRTRHTPAPP